VKESIRKFALEAGGEFVGFANVSDYESPRSPSIEKLFPAAKSIVVIAYAELSTCESPSPQIAMNGRMDLMEFSRSVNYKVARFIERKLGAAAMTVPISYPLEMSMETMGGVGEVSLRHAAVAAGLGAFGRHNLVIHPELGTRVLFTAILTDLDLPSDPKAGEDLCIDCGLCVENCPAGALDKEGFTDFSGCLKNSQPYGLGGMIRFWSQVFETPEQERKKLFYDSHYWKLYQAGFIGFQYVCWKCMASCPVGSKKGQTPPTP